jgi:hypothetical protein
MVWFGGVGGVGRAASSNPGSRMEVQEALKSIYAKARGACKRRFQNQGGT